VSGVVRGLPELESFRGEIRDWIAPHRPPELADLADWYAPLMAGTNRRLLDEAEAHPAYRQWEDRLAEARLICPHWPERVGGRGLDAAQMAVLHEELYRAGVPRVTRGMGESLVGPSIIVHGTEEQQAYFLPRIVEGTDRYCQGFSEPGAGSDLAGVQTAGVVDGEEIVITGQKLWTSGAARANMIFVLCRTDPAAPRHRGLSYVLGELALDILGAAALAGDEVATGSGIGRWNEVFLLSRAGTIYSGTSEIQRNIVAERALGLPKEPGGARTQTGGSP
jgi:alkylation response protein AidB-like acyl-CoA dehydrogenase